ncbi:MAG: xanthine dehydrogenase family protein molybdopterin-binding subunit [Alphaproteobacteria bacterium]|nr:xanthine dehydrogenase family protein molybdopterin-binding subunit [Alphaproteobacteria bacterium]
MSVLGRPTPRVEAPLKVAGRAKYAGDNHPADMLYAAMVGSPIPAGQVIAVDTAQAAAVPGVARILTHEDMPKLGKLSEPAAITYIPLTAREVQWEGQAVALVLAETLEAAEEAAALVRADIAPARALMPGRGKLEPAPAGGIFPPKETKGSVAAGLSEADRQLKRDYFQPTRNHNPMETSACIAAWDGDRLTLWDSTQMNLNAPQVMAAAFGVPKENVQMISPHTGGGFGCKGHVWPHEILAAAAAKLVGRPVKLQLTRAQQYSMVGHQPECRQTITLGANADGKLTAMRHEAINTTSISDTQFEATAMATRTYYACPNIETDQYVERINLVKSSPMRAPVEGPGSWALESAIDELAADLGIDPLDLRLKNFAEREPFDDKPWSSNKLREAYAEASAVFGWRGRHEMPRQDGVWSLGRGMSMASTFCARFPSEARVRITTDGGVLVESSSNDIGTGNQTVVVLAAADALGVDPKTVSFRWGDTRYPPAGPVYGSSQTMGMGGAARLAALDARRKLTAYGAPAEGPLDLAALMARANVAEVIGEGKFGFSNNAPASLNGSGTPWAMQSWGANFVEVGVDRDLGLVRLRRVVARYSAGRIINPLAARSQMIGAIVWEWGKATMEASQIEPRYGRFLAKNLSNVAVPVNADIPADAIDVGFIEEFDPHASPIGARGIGELGATGVAAAIANAVYDATGVRVREVPILPHRILEGLAQTA